MSWYSIIQKYFGFIFAAGMALGFFLPDFFMPVNDRIILILCIVMTLTFLSLDLKSITENLKRFHNIAVTSIISKVVFPFLLYRMVLPLGADISIAMLLLALTPFAAVSPTLTKILGGDTEFVLISQILQTLLAPVYFPLLLMLFAGKSIQIDVLQLMKTLLMLIIIPFIVSVAVRPFLKAVIEKTVKYYSAVSILLITLLLTGMLAGVSGPVRENPALSFQMAGWTMLLGAVLVLAGWFCFFFLDRRKRIGLAVGNVYINIGLTAVIASEFFSPEILTFILLFELPVNIYPPLMGKIKLFRPEKENSG